MALPVGAVGTYLVGLGARERLRISAAAALGVATTDGVFALVAAVGGAGLQAVLRPAARPLTYLAAAVLLVLAVRTVVSAAVRHRGRSTDPRAKRRSRGPLRAYLALIALIALTASNPTTLLYFAALVIGSQGGDGAPTATSATVFAVGAFAASASWQLLLAGGGAMLGRLITGPRGQLSVAIVSGAIMIALAGAVLASGSR